MRYLFAFLVFVACASAQVTTPGRISLHGSGHNQAFTAAIQAVQEANFILKNFDRATGFIYATKGANLMAKAEEVSLSISVTESEDGAIITLRSTLPGQTVAWGVTRGLAEEYCNALARIEPGAIFQIDGMPYDPNGAP